MNPALASGSLEPLLDVGAVPTPARHGDRRSLRVGLLVLLIGGLVEIVQVAPAAAGTTRSALRAASRAGSVGGARQLCRRRRGVRGRGAAARPRGGSTAPSGRDSSRGTGDEAAGASGADAASAEGGGAAAGAAPPPGTLQRGARVEFDGRLVQGQTAKSGAIYLFARKRSELRSMIVERTEYRTEILQTVYPERP